MIKKITDEEFKKFIKTYYIQLWDEVYEFNGGSEEKENCMESSSYHAEECMMGNVSDFIDEVRAEKNK